MNNPLEYWETMERDLEFQLRVAETVKTSNVTIPKEYAYLLWLVARENVQKLKEKQS